MLRYVFYDCSKDNVKLKDEINYVENFISFQRMKSEHEQNIYFEHQEAYPECTISPMLFIPFIENAFKYSKIEELEHAWIKIKLATSNGKIFFNIENSVPEKGKPQGGQGMGISNVRQRLEVLYPQKHSLKIEEKDFIFKVQLEINK
jgi:LytS/YehU family sensor histidine kinase